MITVYGWALLLLAALLLPTPEQDVFRLTANAHYSVEIVVSAYQPNTVTLRSAELGERGLTFALESNALPESGTYPDHFALPAETESGWGLSYVVYALNEQAEDWTQPYDYVSGILVLSPDEQTVAFFICNISGGRGQWCSTPRLWFFDQQTGEARRVEMGDYGVLYVTDLRFSDDNSRHLSADSCLKYLYPGYFGTCGVDAVTTWDVATGSLFALSVVPA
jgi:hypothetical protein